MDVTLGVVGLDRWDFVGFEFANVEVLDEIGYEGLLGHELEAPGTGQEGRADLG